GMKPRSSGWSASRAAGCCPSPGGFCATRRRPATPIEDLLPQFQADGHQVHHPTPEWEGSAQMLLARKETRAIVREAIDRLPGSYRDVLLLRDIEELSTQEAARSLGVTANAVKIRLHRARQALRGLLEPHFRGTVVG